MAASTGLMRLAFRLTVQRLDGIDDTQPNADGVLPGLMAAKRTGPPIWPLRRLRIDPDTVSDPRSSGVERSEAMNETHGAAHGGGCCGGHGTAKAATGVKDPVCGMTVDPATTAHHAEIGRASCRERVCSTV